MSTLARGVALCVLLSASVAHASGDDVSGDVRPNAAAILELAATHGDALTTADARALGLAPIHLAELPTSIRIWRRGLDGSSTSCAGRVDVIPMEQYVKGVLPHEWIRSWDDESLKAGAVAIRTYASAWVESGGKYDCADLDDTTASQVYKDEFFANTDADVDATAGQVVVRDGALVFAEYSAENGDPTAFDVDEPQCTGHAVNGHGRGTCQWGTQRWALAGKDYVWMMRHYYPGADVTSAAPAWGASLAGQDFSTELVSGDEMVVCLEYTNDGSTTWDPSTVFIGTTGPRDRASAFYKDGNWVSPSRPTGADHSDIGGGDVARFTWAMVAPEVTEPTTFTETFGLVTADGEFFGPADDAVTWTITVTPREVPIGSDPGEDETSGGCDAGGGQGAIMPLLIAVVLVMLRRRRDGAVAALAGSSALMLAVVLGGCTMSAAPAPTRERAPLGGDSRLVPMFHDASLASGVPAELLATISYVETRLRFVGDYVDDTHPGHTGAGAIGLLALREAEVARAAALAGLDEPAVHTEELASVEAAAALLRELAGASYVELADWHDALVAYAGDTFADEVYARLRAGWTGRDATGAEVTLSAIDVDLPGGVTQVVQGLGYPGATWSPAYSGNYAAGSRGAADINYIVIHTVQGSYDGCISWFKNSAAEVSSHYVVRSSDGDVTQMVDDSDVAWHDACFNSQSIGIEHEGYVADPDAWYTEAMYVESAKLTSWLASSYGIPKDHAHIMGHGETPDCSDHSDPGSGWNWDHYLDLVQTGGAPSYNASPGESSYPMTMVSGEDAVAWFDFENDSNVTWGLDDTRLGTQDPQDRASAFFVDGNWLSPSRATGADHSNYAPGTTGRFTFAIRAPEVTETTTFDESFQLVQEGVTWFGPVVHMTITVSPRDGGSDDGLDGNPDLTAPDDGGELDGGCTAGGASLSPLLMLALLGLRRRRR